MSLITNFCAGELSKNLFGRIDLPQYHSGAAHLENFDVIPTGGIKRRSGFQRMGQVAMKGPARLIPVVISRKEKYLLLLESGQIQYFIYGEYRAPKKILSETGGSSPRKLSYKDEELDEIQYAQHQRMLVLTHQNHPPVLINFNSPGNVSIMDYNISDLVSQVYEKGLVLEFMPEHDKTYSSGHLKQPGQYPRSCVFFNGRMVFASTIAHGQRLYFSKVNSFHNFSTYNSYVTEIKNFVTVKCIVTQGSDVVELKDSFEVEKIVPPMDIMWYVNSTLFPEGTYMKSIPIENGGKIYMTFSKPAQNINKVVTIPDSVKQELEQKVVAFNNANAEKIEYTSIMDIVTSDGKGFRRYNIEIGASEFRLTSKDKDGKIEKEKTIKLDSDWAQMFDTNNDATKNALEKLVENSIYTFSNEIFGYDGTPTFAYKDYTIETVVNAWRSIIMANMKYSHSSVNGGKPFYGYMFDIEKEVLALISLPQSVEMYIPMFTKEQRKDDVVTPDCGFTFEVASGMNEPIMWLCANRGIVVGTEMSEYLIPPDVHAGNVRAIKTSNCGSDSVAAVSIGDATCFLQSGRKGIVEYYPNEYDAFRANNLAMLAPQMLHESPAKQIDFMTAPNTKLVILREDGILVTLLYDRATGTFAWNRYTTGEETVDVITQKEIDDAHAHWKKYVNNDFGQNKWVVPTRMERRITGKIIAAAVLPGDDGFDDIYVITLRSGRYNLERLREEGDVYLDCWQEWKYFRLDEYTFGDGAVVYDPATNRSYPFVDGVSSDIPYMKHEAGEPPKYIGYPYKSIMRSMPVVKDGKMSEVNMTSMLVRLSNSFMPNIWNTGGDDDLTPTNGVCKIVNMFSGTTRNLQFDIVHEDANRCCVLSVYTEV